MAEKPEVKVKNNEKASRFETTVDEALAVAEYELEPGVITRGAMRCT